MKRKRKSDALDKGRMWKQRKDHAKLATWSKNEEEAFKYPQHIVLYRHLRKDHSHEVHITGKVM